ncbi:PTS glucose transporter subunit IIA [Sporolactobacillus shoreicorticis]|uniref:PTS glucose transporter subunit IIA n=1 Tax=Sporolactobacillus shoreicorticis TaxID=1923877 RepID=A0ABW5S413_9BACL|nr:PTS glucose transporter subunit IIA [Sporolactobacillus shoreicorticis]MCO7124396.1 PTS glucose transporter subunit IIA [Sporolactobacillus shoreicorticis]
MFGKLFQKQAIKEEKVYAPISGKSLMVTDVPDPVFSEKMMGEGMAITPDIRTHTIVAPVDGEVIQLASTKHAFGIRSKLGEEILVHIGLDTVELKGEGFENLVKVGDKVKVGRPVMKVDFDYISEQGKGIMVPIVITNTAEDKFSFNWSELTQVKAGESVLFTSTLKN